MSTPAIDDYVQQYELSHPGYVLPMIYRDDLSTRLDRVSNSLFGRANSTEFKKEDHQKDRKEYVEHHWFWGRVPYSFSMGDTYNIGNSYYGRGASPTRHSSSSSQENKEMSPWVQILVGGVALFVLYITAKLIGNSIGELNGVDQDLSNIWKAKQYLADTKAQQINLSRCAYQVGPEQQYYDPHPILNKEIELLEEVVNDPFLSQERSRVLQDLALRVTVAASAIIALTGALIASQGLIVGGTLFGVLSLAGILIKYGITESDSTIKQAALDLQTKIYNFVVKLKDVPNKQYPAYFQSPQMHYQPQPFYN